MRKPLFKFFVLNFILLVSLPSVLTANLLEEDIDLILAKNHGGYHSMGLPVGYSDKQMDINRFPFNHPEVEKVLQDIEDESLKQWQDYVDKRHIEYLQGEYTEFDFSNDESILHAKNNPRLYLGLDPNEKLNPIENVFVLYKKTEAVGYVIELFNAIRANLIEDGSGIVLYLDLDFKLVAKTEWDS